MNALPMGRVLLEPGAKADRSQISIWHRPLLAKQGPWPLFGILTAFWIYVALSNVLYGMSMQSVLMTLRMHNVYAPWNARLLQHVFLYPVLLGCVWASLRIGWQPLWRAAPLQLACALGFSTLASPALMLGEKLTGDAIWHDWQMQPMQSALEGFVSGPAIPLWLASVTNFLLTYGFGLALVVGLRLLPPPAGCTGPFSSARALIECSAFGGSAHAVIPAHSVQSVAHYPRPN